MKQLIIAKNVAYDSSAKATDYTSVKDGALAFVDLTTHEVITDEPKHNFAVVCGRDDKQPIVFSEVDVKTLTVTKAEPQEGAKFSVDVTIPAVEKGQEYTLMVVKAGTVFNERNTWTFTTLAKTTEPKDVATALEKAINANKENLGVTAKADGTKLTIEGTKIGDNFRVLGADGLMGIELEPTSAKPALLDKAYVQDLASRCAAGKGFNDTYRDGDSIYPGYPEPVEADQYVLYTLRFAVPRVAAKQRDEVVYQRLHLAIPVGAGAITTLDSMFAIKAATSTASLLED